MSQDEESRDYYSILYSRQGVITVVVIALILILFILWA